MVGSLANIYAYNYEHALLNWLTSVLKIISFAFILRLVDELYRSSLTERARDNDISDFMRYVSNCNETGTSSLHDGDCRLLHLIPGWARHGDGCECLGPTSNLQRISMKISTRLVFIVDKL